MKNLRESRAITLVALIVTIIILLILAGITIYLISGNEGILNRATTAVDKTNIVAAKEQVMLTMANDQSEYYEKKYVDENIVITEKLGDWIYKEHEGETIDAGGYLFTINLPNDAETANEENPYVVTINQSHNLPNQVTGTLSINGVLKWDDELVSNGGSNEDGMSNDTVSKGDYEALQEQYNLLSEQYSGLTQEHNTLTQQYNDLLEKFNVFNPQNITFITGNRSTCTVPSGVKEVYVLYVNGTNYLDLNCNISGTIIKSSEEVAYITNVDNYGVQMRVSLRIYKLELTGEEGTITVKTSGGSGNYRAWTSMVMY